MGSSGGPIPKNPKVADKAKSLDTRPLTTPITRVATPKRIIQKGILLEKSQTSVSTLVEIAKAIFVEEIPEKDIQERKEK
jgi:hypothetical protein